MKTWQKMWLRIPRVIRWTAVDALLLAGGAALYGLLFGGFEAALHHEPGRVLAAMGCFTLGGLIAGAILGAFGALMEPAESVHPTRSVDTRELPSELPSRPMQADEERAVPFETAKRSRETYLQLRVASAMASHHFRM